MPTLDIPPQRLSISGFIFPAWEDRQPLLFDLGSDQPYLFLFSDVDLLEEEAKRSGWTYDRILRVQSGTDFVQSVIAIGIDPSSETGKTCFKQIVGLVSEEDPS